MRLQRRLVTKIICSQRNARRETKGNDDECARQIFKRKRRIPFQSIVSNLVFPVTLGRHRTEPQIPVVDYPSLLQLQDTFFESHQRGNKRLK